ncbi:hypothetical protein [Bacillus ndiopicus]|uniref:hypothetical protein n=1 Tax=Bacillus ndiopicus TaxID=1347368 RepID=UPI0005A715BD|nr:hypothetical protein [Bacillus ndiopicus]
MIKKQYLGEITLGASVPNLVDGINSLWEQIQNEYDPKLIEVHQIVAEGPGRYVIIYNYYL